MTLDKTCNEFNKTEKDTFIPVFEMFSTWIKDQYKYTSKSKLEQKVLDIWLNEPSTYLKFGFITFQKCSVYEYSLLGLLYTVPEELPFSVKKIISNYLSKSRPLQQMHEEYIQQILDVPKAFLEKDF